jgi:hypothetical protein
MLCHLRNHFELCQLVQVRFSFSIAPPAEKAILSCHIIALRGTTSQAVLQKGFRNASNLACPKQA